MQSALAHRRHYGRRFIYAPGDDGSFSDYNLVADPAGGIYVLWNDELISMPRICLAKRLLADGSLAPGWLPHGNIIVHNVMVVEIEMELPGWSWRLHLLLV